MTGFEPRTSGVGSDRSANCIIPTLAQSLVIQLIRDTPPYSRPPIYENQLKQKDANDMSEREWEKERKKERKKINALDKKCLSSPN